MGVFHAVLLHKLLGHYRQALNIIYPLLKGLAQLTLLLIINNKVIPTLYNIFFIFLIFLFFFLRVFLYLKYLYKVVPL